MEDEHGKWIQTGFPSSTQKSYSIVKELQKKTKKPPRSGLVQPVIEQFLCNFSKKIVIGYKNRLFYDFSICITFHFRCYAENCVRSHLG